MTSVSGLDRTERASAYSVAVAPTRNSTGQAPASGRDAAAAAEPEAPDLYVSALRGLPKRYRRFIRTALDTGDYLESARVSGFKVGSRSVVYLLGLARVRRALQLLAPLHPDGAVRRRLLEPLADRAIAGAMLDGRTGAAQRVGAARELLAPAAPGATTGGPSVARSGGASTAPGSPSTYQHRRQEQERRREQARAAAGLTSPTEQEQGPDPAIGEPQGNA